MKDTDPREALSIVNKSQIFRPETEVSVVIVGTQGHYWEQIATYCGERKQTGSTTDYPPPPMQSPDGARAAAAAQRQQRDQALAATTQRDSHESLALLREAVLHLAQQATRGLPTSAPTSRLTKLGPDDDVEAYLEVFERTARR